ncbi:hypothetical protein IFM89_032680 [Coptis chinensis]|uniref:Uncharacterized protein n=1 Tax=Coptis chinensis TaxID=261450 RepID=A0A835IF67_9MAGN|nr:hypothetical protein IFM89_032680 [Coptis chinensis]
MHRLICRRDESTLTKLVVDRSCGQLVDFTLTNTADEFLFCYVIDRSNLLKCFRLVRSEIYGEDVADAAKKLPSLEELELCHCMLGRSDIRDIGRSCTQLKHLRLNGHSGKERPLERDEEAFAIAESMPELRGLHLYGNKCMTNEGLQAILDGCPYLEYLNLRRCTGIDTSGELLKNRLGRIKNVRLPDDPTDDYELDDVDHVSDPYFDDYPSPPNYDDEGNYLSDYDYDYDYDYEQLLQ